MRALALGYRLPKLMLKCVAEQFGLKVNQAKDRHSILLLLLKQEHRYNQHPEFFPMMVGNLNEQQGSGVHSKMYTRLWVSFKYC